MFRSASSLVIRAAASGNRGQVATSNLLFRRTVSNTPPKRQSDDIVTKEELRRQIANALKQNMKDATRALDTVLEKLIENLEAGKKIKLGKFGHVSPTSVTLKKQGTSVPSSNGKKKGEDGEEK